MFFLFVTSNVNKKMYLNPTKLMTNKYHIMNFEFITKSHMYVNKGGQPIKTVVNMK
jgi:hypothetical protein